MRPPLISQLIAISLLFLSCGKDSGSGNDNGNPNPKSEFEIDQSFNSAGPNGSGKSAGAIQADGKIIVGSYGFYRLNKDGSVDNSFNPPHVFKDDFSSISSIEVLSNGQVLVAGDFKISNAISLLVRLNSDGSIDNSFVPLELQSPGGNTSSPSIANLFVQQDGKIIVAGDFYYNPSGNYTGGEDIVRLNADGTRDFSFASYISSAASSFIEQVVQQKDGKFVAAGSFTAKYDGQNRTTLMRINSDGVPDLSFNFEDNLIGSIGFQGILNTVFLLDDGKMLIGGDFYQFGKGTNAIPYKQIARVDNNGKLDQNFKSPEIGAGSVTSIESVSGNRLLVGRRSPDAFDRTETLTLLSADGVVDKGFTPAFKNLSIEQIIKTDNSFVLVGSFQDDQNDYGVARLIKK